MKAKAFIARDNDNELFIYFGQKPYKAKYAWALDEGEHVSFAKIPDKDLFPEVTWEDEIPTEVTIEIVGKKSQQPQEHSKPQTKFDPNIKNQNKMKKYIGTKTIMAKPMAKSEAEKVLNRSLADAKGGEDGYLVEYPDGYKSWSPKETFEEAYKVADTYLDRMRIEYADVKERVLKMHTFLMSEEFRELPKEKQSKLQSQCGAMSAYVEILGQRIDEAKLPTNCRCS